MRYRIVAVGRLSRGFLRAGCDRYLGAVTRWAPCEMVEVRGGKGADAEEVRAQEARALRSAADGRRVVLDERGTAWTTARLARHVQELELSGTSRLSLLIGGAEGVASSLRDEADEVWRLSDLTLPHELARLVLLEQLYRIETLRAGHPYHRA
ncbi:MAG: 23S rRNA (pseudouridine(1915)-N(3))-methyltransferase RlmH [Trueperaceae bacterium]